MRSLRQHRSAALWILLLGAWVAGIVGYFGPWIPHRAAGLVVTGVDLAEYVKFVPQASTGNPAVVREAFYAPLVSGSLLASVIATRRAFPRWLRLTLGIAAVPLAMAMLPPAWSPAALQAAEYRRQVAAILICLAALPLTVITRRLPDRLICALGAVLALIAGIWPAWSFLQIRPAIDTLYHSGLGWGWGFLACTAAYLLLALFSLVLLLRPGEHRTSVR